MNNDACDEDTNQPIYLNNEDKPYATVFGGAAPAPNAGTAAGAGAVLGEGSLLRSENNDGDFE